MPTDTSHCGDELEPGQTECWSCRMDKTVQSRTWWYVLEGSTALHAFTRTAPVSFGYAHAEIEKQHGRRVAQMWPFRAEDLCAKGDDE